MQQEALLGLPVMLFHNKMKENKKIGTKIVKNNISYNAFKMWGSYIGFMIFFVYGLFGTVCTGSCIPNQYLFSGIILGILGFIIGYAIHSLFRYLKNKNGEKKK